MVRRCPQCQQTKPLSEFWYIRKSRRWGTYCKPCNVVRQKAFADKDRDAYNAKRREQYRRRMQNPKYAAAKRKEWLAQKKKEWAADPEKASQRRVEYNRRHRENLRKDPERYRQYLEDQRILAALSRERLNGVARKKRQRPSLIAPDPDRMLPSAPLVDWVQRRSAFYGSLGALAEKCGVDGKALRMIPADGRISLYKADRLLTREDTTLLHDLWTEEEIDNAPIRRP